MERKVEKEGTEMSRQFFFPTTIQAIVIFIICVADLNNIQTDSQSEIIQLSSVMPKFLISALPIAYAFSSCFILVGLVLEIASLRSKGKVVSIGLVPVILWFLLLVLHCLPNLALRCLSIGSEDLYILQWVIAAVAFVYFSIALSLELRLLSVSSWRGTRSTTSSELKIEPTDGAASKKERLVEEPLVKPFLRDIKDNSNYGGSIRRRRPKQSDKNSLERALATLELRYRPNRDKPYDGSILGTGARSCVSTATTRSILAPSKFLTSTSAVASFGKDLRKDDNYETAPLFQSTASTICSFVSSARSTVTEDDASSMFTSISQRYASSTVFSSSVLRGPAVQSKVGNEWLWRTVAGIILMLSLLTNVAVMGYLISMRD